MSFLVLRSVEVLDKTTEQPLSAKPDYAYEQLDNASASTFLVKADDILLNGWKRGGYPPFMLDDKVPWVLESQAQRSWNFHIHSWAMLDTLLSAYSEFADKKYLLPSITVALDWVSEYVEKGIDTAATDLSFAWYDMAVGLRAYRLAYIIDAGRKANLLSAKDDKRLWRALLEHQSYLADDANIIFHNNHGYYQVAGQLAMGRRFRDESKKMAEAFIQGEQRLQKMLVQQFASDGVHREHSPDYHRMVYDTLSGLIASGLVSDASIIESTVGIENALAWFIMPNQRLVNFGDTDYHDVSRTPKEAARKWQTPDMRWRVSGGHVGENVSTGLQRFEEGGYFIYRQPHTEYSTQITYLAQTAAFHSRTHKHADDLSFVWYDRGNEVLVDAGRYGYLGKTPQGSELWHAGYWYSDPNRIYCESTRAHNCLEFDGENYTRKSVKPYGSAIGRSLEDSSGLIVLETECRHFKGNRHARVLILNPGEWLIVFDWYHDNLQQERAVKQWFHLAQDWTLQTDGNGFYALSNDKEQRLSIGNFNGESTPSKLYFGEELPQLQGWWSPAERQLLPNYAFNFSNEKTVTGNIATIFSFSEELHIDPSKQAVASSGRSMKFTWSTEQGTYRLNLSRQQEGPLEVVYKTDF